MMRRVAAGLAMGALLAGAAPTAAQDDCETRLLSARVEDAALPAGMAWTLLRPVVETGGWTGALYDDGDRYRLSWACVADGALFMARLRDSLDMMGATVVGSAVIGDESVAVRAGDDPALYLLLWRRGDAVASLDGAPASSDISAAESLAAALDDALASS